MDGRQFEIYLGLLFRALGYKTEVTRSAGDYGVTTGKICPRCGNPLVLRKGPRGEFHGCSNFPKCRHIG